ncbi:hypothetical protein PR048_026009 [Dryococelus australis]|uniref:Uncharacterized protein n=1 Tax=Dryococelus australis TaxID=614101 RepID=A0ABQ9GK51_9NEOP|nr:hypothetical protein PR048_026009 [Dryococelus australis]
MEQHRNERGRKGGHAQENPTPSIIVWHDSQAKTHLLSQLMINVVVSVKLWAVRNSCLVRQACPEHSILRQYSSSMCLEIKNAQSSNPRSKWKQLKGLFRRKTGHSSITTTSGLSLANRNKEAWSNEGVIHRLAASTMSNPNTLAHTSDAIFTAAKADAMFQENSTRLVNSPPTTRPQKIGRKGTRHSSVRELEGQRLCLCALPQSTYLLQSQKLKDLLQPGGFGSWVNNPRPEYRRILIYQKSQHQLSLDGAGAQFLPTTSQYFLNNLNEEMEKQDRANNRVACSTCRRDKRKVYNVDEQESTPTTAKCLPSPWQQWVRAEVRSSWSSMS